MVAAGLVRLTERNDHIRRQVPQDEPVVKINTAGLLALLDENDLLWEVVYTLLEASTLG